MRAARRWTDGLLGVLVSALMAMVCGWDSARPAASRRGSVVVTAVEDSSGRPIAGVDVEIARPGAYSSESHWEPRWSAYTDSTGLATIERIPSGSYNVGLCSNVHQPVFRTVEVVASRSDTIRAVLKYLGRPADGRQCEIRFTFSGVGFVGGKVIILATEAESGMPVVFANVTVLEAWTGGMTDESGSVVLNHLEPGTRQFRIEAVGRVSSTGSVVVASGKVDTLRFKLAPSPGQPEIH